MSTHRFGGPWTEEKLAILRAYLDAYTTALKNQRFTLIYVDAFAGPGSYAEFVDEYAEFHEFRRGSPMIALEIVDRPFDRLVFIEKDAKAAGDLMTLSNKYEGRQISIIQGDANLEIPKFCRNMAPLDRAVVFLDPFKTEVSWPTVEDIARTKQIDCWILFPLMATTRMMPRGREPDETWADELDRVFGCRGHWKKGYQDAVQTSFLSTESGRERTWGWQQVAQRYKERLRTVFHEVAGNSRTLKNSMNVPLFELFFAAGNPKGAPIAVQIADHILKNL